MSKGRRLTPKCRRGRADRSKVGVSHPKVDEATDTRQAVRQDGVGTSFEGWAIVRANEAESGRE